MSHFNSTHHALTSSVNGPSSQTGSSVGNRPEHFFTNPIVAQAPTDDRGSYAVVPSGMRGISRAQYDVPKVTSTTAAATAAAYDWHQRRSVDATNRLQTADEQNETNYYRYEINRLHTFRTPNWPEATPVEPEELAATGLYFIGVGDYVRCAFCNGTLKQWEQGDNPENEHKKFFPNCPFLRGVDVGNVPAAKRSLVSESFPVEFRENVFQRRDTPMYPEFRDREQRLQTFKGSTMRVGPTAEQLASCGFYAIGHDDAVVCYWCGGSLKQWQQHDQAWSEHARWFPHCSLIQQMPNAPASSATVSSNETVSNMPVSVASCQVHDEEQQMDWFSTGQNETGQSGQDMNIGNLPPHVANMSLDDDRVTCSTTTSGTVCQAEKRSDEFSCLGEKIGDLSPLEKHFKSDDAAEKSSSEMMQGLLEENRRLKDAIVCKLCMENDVNTLFLPCGHLVSCDKCALALNLCPVCRSNIRGTIRTYL